MASKFHCSLNLFILVVLIKAPHITGVAMEWGGGYVYPFHEPKKNKIKNDITCNWKN